MDTPSSRPEDVCSASGGTGLQANLIHWQEWQAVNSHIFPTPESWRWFFRRNRAELVRAGALCLLAGRIFVVPDRLASAAMSIGAEALRRREGEADALVD